MADINPYFSSDAMPNEYFNHQGEYSADKLLYQSLLAENYNKNGVPCVFYVTDYNTSHDKIFGEDSNRHVIRSFDFMAMFELPFSVELFSKFGIEGMDNYTADVSIAHFNVASTYGISGAISGADLYPSHIPVAGDIVKSKYNETYYEIILVKKQEVQFLQLQHSYRFTMRVLADNHLTVADSLSGDSLSSLMDIADIYNISGAIDIEKQDVLYDGSGEKAKQDPFSAW